MSDNEIEDGQENAPPPGKDGEAAPQKEADAPDPHAPPASMNNDGVEKQKPEGLADKFWDPKKGELRTDALIKSYGDLSEKMRQKNEDYKAEIRAELEGESKSEDVPESVDGYALADELKEAIADDDPLLAAFREAAHESKLPVSVFNSIVGKVAASQVAPDPAAEKAKLGEDADTRIEAVEKYITRHIKDDNLKELAQQVAVTGEGVMLMEALMQSAIGSQTVSRNDTQGSAPTVTKASIKRMMNDDRYQPGPLQDPAYIAEVEQQWALLHKQA